LGFILIGFYILAEFGKLPFLILWFLVIDGLWIAALNFVTHDPEISKQLKGTPIFVNGSSGDLNYFASPESASGALAYTLM